MAIAPSKVIYERDGLDITPVARASARHGVNGLKPDLRASDDVTVEIPV